MKKEIVSVAREHIQPGIKKYQGKVDSQLAKLIAIAGFNYTPYLFNDGRVLLVLPHDSAAFIYQSKEHVYKKLNLD